MTYQITDTSERNGKVVSAAVRVGETNQEVLVCSFGDLLTVCVNNASHKVFRGNGRTFRSAAAALAAYKSAAVKGAIETALEAFAA